MKKSKINSLGLGPIPVSYSVSFELEAIEIAKKTSKEQAVRHFKVDAKRIISRPICDWCYKAKEDLRKLSGSHSNYCDSTVLA